MDRLCGRDKVPGCEVRQFSCAGNREFSIVEQPNVKLLLF